MGFRADLTIFDGDLRWLIGWVNSVHHHPFSRFWWFIRTPKLSVQSHILHMSVSSPQHLNWKIVFFLMAQCPMPNKIIWEYFNSTCLGWVWETLLHPGHELQNNSQANICPLLHFLWRSMTPHLIGMRNTDSHGHIKPETHRYSH